ncbi:MAG: carboxypeptidase-like regulatory domain-containing protein [Rhodothermales bacterium]
MPLKPPFFFWLLPLLLLAPLASAQDIDATLIGIITDAETGQPIENVHVFIAVSMNGTTTNAEGNYRLAGVPLGTLRLYVSFVGYEPQARDLFIRSTGTQTYDFQLKPAIVEIGEITVTTDNKKWKRQLEKFTRLFIGETPNASETEIVNPEVLDFSNKGGTFRAQASEPLILENKALGYRIQYFLKDFAATMNRTQYDGEPLYEEMAPESPEQSALWHARRDSAFYGSFRHFMLALLNNRVEEQGFKTYSRPSSGGPGGSSLGGSAFRSDQRYPLDPTTIIKEGQSPDERILDFDGFVEIVYTGETESKSYLRWAQRPYGSRPRFRTSMIRVEKGPTVVDLKGDVLDPYGVTFYQYLAFERVADELPKEYRPWN